MIGAKVVWGIEIGSHAIKGVKLYVRGSDFELVDFDVLSHAGQPEPTDGPIVDRRAVRTLTLFQERNRIGTEHVAVAVSGRSIFTRPIEIIEVSGKDTEELVRFEVQQHVGIDLDSVLWDYELFAAQESDPERRRKGVLFAMKKADYNVFIRGLEAARIHVDDVQTAPLALCNFVRYEYAPEAPVLVLDVGAANVAVLVVYGDRYWTRIIQTGGNLLTAALQEKFQADYGRSEAIKLHVAESEHSREVLQLMLPAMRAIAGEIQNALNLFRNDVPGVSFEKILALGGASKTLGFCRLLSQRLGGTVVAPRRFERFRVAPGVDKARLNALAPELAVAAGLAVQGAGRAASKVSLVSAGTVRGKHLARTRPFAIAALMVAAVLVSLSLYFAYAQRDRLRAANQQLSALVNDVEAVRRGYAEVTKRSPEEERLRAFHAVGKHRGAVMTVLGHIARMFTAADTKRRTWIQDFDIQQVKSTRGGERYVPEGTLRVHLTGVVERRGAADNESNAWDDIKQTIGNYLSGWADVQLKGDISYIPVGKLDSEVMSRQAGWQYMVFKVTFDFKPKSDEKELPQ